MSFDKLFSRFNHSRSAKDQRQNTDQRVTRGVISLLQRQRLLGEVLLQLPRKFDLRFSAVMGLEWENNKLLLFINPDKLDNLSSDEIENLLEHEALHIIWLHPLRYAANPHQHLVQIATDVAVNQYISEPPRNTATLSQLQQLLRQKIAPRLDSQDYLDLLEKLPIEQQEKLRHAGVNLDKDRGKGNAVDDNLQKSDSHHGWRATIKDGHQLNNQLIKLASIKQLLAKAWEQTPQRDRGLLPGNIKSQLQNIKQMKAVNWQQVLKHQFGLLARGQIESHARFNRRQPLRMDLAGKVTRLTPAIDIFVDNSGSVSDEELDQALATIEKMISHTKLTATVYSFDAKVTSKEQLRGGKKFIHTRSGGGGTSFQCVFDYLHQHNLTKRGRTIIIITDGWGEERINTYHYRNIYWLMMTKTDQLSVKDPVGKVLEMR
ncbi:VWA-like domain-containing protein [Limosilactobacillus caviae]|uniref:Peptidase n=1 Tax=Limosilactobacillus caviae TaxID=1769424 RepID=A0ABQ2C408_9LACO|nr:VWA-like domain-containing protein [Limosilactobacillus caviae]MCD7124203.1 VWA-like domain-containing protein [Limosilactobacillus caviae]MRH45405.1 peptidase [Limosilactobacillus reuteri]GGI62474.1 hypothetical protein GCM10011459_03080 [Limosilactobacillus caviae]